MYLSPGFIYCLFPKNRRVAARAKVEVEGSRATVAEVEVKVPSPLLSSGGEGGQRGGGYGGGGGVGRGDVPVRVQPRQPAVPSQPKKLSASASNFVPSSKQ